MLHHVNAHIHTPYSFSAFGSIDQALDAALAEDVKVVGINDFYSTEGYGSWMDGCARRGLYPLFGIEFIALDAALRDAGLRVNDPGNPGRTYISGKGLCRPLPAGSKEARELESLRAESNAQAERMCAKLNEYLRSEGIPVELSFSEIKATLTSGLVRERHLAKALRMKLHPDAENPAAEENDLRSRLLKAGKPAFVPENPEAFLPVEDVQRIIEAAGGIPTYPFLGDDASGGFTDFEADLQKAADSLRSRGFRSAEFITTRNTTAVLERYAGFLEDEGFIVTFGSEHNTPAMEPLKLRTRDCPALSEKLQEINWRGACAIAAHQAGLDSPAAGEELILKTLEG